MKPRAKKPAAKPASVTPPVPPPTIGRIVHYRRNRHAQPLAALVVAVGEAPEERVVISPEVTEVRKGAPPVTLHVFTDSGLFIERDVAYAASTPPPSTLDFLISTAYGFDHKSPQWSWPPRD